MPSSKRVVAVLSDLMFTVKIQQAAKEVGLEPVFVKSKEKALEQARQGAAVIILDLNNAGLNSLDVIGALKAHEDTRNVPLLGFVSHVQADLKQAAQQKGCDMVLPRSSFSKNLPAILKRHAED